MYKILAKALDCRFQKVLPIVISLTQGAFVKGKQVLDGVLIANKCINYKFKEGSPSLLCKLDFEKAYDRVDWDFF